LEVVVQELLGSLPLILEVEMVEIHPLVLITLLVEVVVVLLLVL
tara:strand:- start:371 stop:502 length:132 start_codon:yes stop_codon:yes gene_type:complete